MDQCGKTPWGYYNQGADSKTTTPEGDHRLLDAKRYQRITAFLRKTYDEPLYEQGGLRHPVLFTPADEPQRADINSALGRDSGEIISRDELAFYNHAHLHTMQNSQANLFNGPTFTFRLLRHDPLRVDADRGAYFDMVATCIALEAEIIAASVTGSFRLPMRSQYHRFVEAHPALSRGKGRSAGLGAAACTVFRDGDGYSVLLSRRTAKHATRPGAIHLLPAFMLQPMDNAPSGGWDLAYHLRREWLEELFGLPEGITAMDDDPAMRDWYAMQESGMLQAQFVGLATNLLTMRIEFCLLVVIHDPAWWPRVTAPHAATPLRAESESASWWAQALYEDDAALQAALPADMHLNMPPHVIPAFWEGIAQARRLIQNFQSTE